MSNEIAIAVVNVKQVNSIRDLFVSFGQTFFIKPADERTEFVSVYLRGARFSIHGNFVPTGWDDATANTGFGFDMFMARCKRELKRL